MSDKEEWFKSYKLCEAFINTHTEQIKAIEENIDYAKFKIQDQRIEALEGIKETSKRERWENAKFNEIDDRFKALEASSASHTEEINTLYDFVHQNVVIKNNILEEVLRELFDAHDGEFEEEWTERMREKLDSPKQTESVLDFSEAKFHPNKNYKAEKKDSIIGHPVLYTNEETKELLKKDSGGEKTVNESQKSIDSSRGSSHASDSTDSKLPEFDTLGDIFAEMAPKEDEPEKDVMISEKTIIALQKYGELISRDDHLKEIHKIIEEFVEDIDNILHAQTEDWREILEALKEEYEGRLEK